MSYETLDKIADSYTPTLLIVFLSGLIRKIYIDWPGVQQSIKIFGFALVLLLISYGLMFIDKAMQLWAIFGMDYSTHTAVSLSLLFASSVLFINVWKSAWKILGVSFLAYAILMWYQRYHSAADILTTTVVISMLSYLIYKLMFSAGKNRAVSSSPATE